DLPVLIFPSHDFTGSEIEACYISSDGSLIMPIIVTKAQVDRKVRMNLPEVLDVKTKIGRIVHTKGLERVISSGGIRVTQEKICEPVTSILPVEIEHTTGATGSMSAIGGAIVVFVANIQSVHAANEVCAGLAPMRFKPKPSGDSPG